MTEQADQAGGTVPLEKLVRVFLKMRAAKDEMVRNHEREVAQLEAGLQNIKQALLGYCKDHNIESVRTSEGTFYRTLKRRYWTNDWEAMGRFIVEHGVPDLLEKRLHQANTQAFLEQHPELLPPGLNVDSEYTVTVRKS